MRSRAVSPLIVAAAVLATILPAAVSAQYMFLDADGDGLNDGGFEYPPSDTATVDLYVVTDRDTNGSPVGCESVDGSFDLTGFTASLESIGGPFTLLSVENAIPGMLELFPPDVHPYGLTFGYSVAPQLPPGQYRLLRMRLWFPQWMPNLMFVSGSCHTLPGVGTTIVTKCPGDDLDYTLPVWGWGMGSFTDPPNRRPTVSAPDSISVTEGEPIAFTIDVADPECGQGTYLFSYSANGVPVGASVSGLSPFAYGEATGTFSWTPTVGQAGTYSIEFVVHDPDTWNWWIDPDVEAVTIVTVAPATPLSANLAPTAHVGGPYSAAQGSPIQFQGSGSSGVAGGALAFSWTFGDGAVEVGSTVVHAFAESGVYDISLTVTDEGGLASEDRTTATITPRSPRASLIASIAPNPITPESAIEFTTTNTGFASVRLFDAGGRLVARTFESSVLGAGRHRIPAIGGTREASTLASGVYFMRLVTEHDGQETRRVTILR